MPEIWAGLLAGRSGIGPIRTLPTARLSATIAGEVIGFDPAAHFTARHAGMMDRNAQFAVVAAREAMADAGLVADPALARRRGVILGAGVGQTSLDAAYLSFYGEGATRVHPFTVPRGMANAAASQVSMELALRGPSFAVSSACASSNHAIGVAADVIRAGRADIVLTGGSDASLTLGYFKGWEALRVLSTDTCRPFSRDRSGLVLGEGAGVLVLEEWDHAERRGATILAELAGFGMTADGLDLTAPDVDGAAQAMRDALEDAGMDPSEVGYVNAHGTGTRLNDRVETAALHQVFGQFPGATPPVSSCKSMIGHCLNAGGALEAVATVMALAEGMLPPTAGYREADPECDVDCVPNVARAASIGAALSNSFAFGGLNAVLAFRRADA